MKKSNLFSNIPNSLPKELIEILVKNKNVKIERIVSKNHKTPEGKWYNQKKNEFVLVLKGKALLSFKDSQSIEMSSGDYLIIPAHKLHRVEKTSPETIWLTIFY